MHSTQFNKRWSTTRRKRLRCASDNIILGTLAHFSHFRHSKKLAHLIVNDVIQSNKYTYHQNT
jgi:hypothetical protein